MYYSQFILFLGGVFLSTVLLLNWQFFLYFYIVNSALTILAHFWLCLVTSLISLVRHISFYLDYLFEGTFNPIISLSKKIKKTIQFCLVVSRVPRYWISCSSTILNGLCWNLKCSAGLLLHGFPMNVWCCYIHRPTGSYSDQAAEAEDALFNPISFWLIKLGIQF